MSRHPKPTQTEIDQAAAEFMRSTVVFARAIAQAAAPFLTPEQAEGVAASLADIEALAGEENITTPQSGAVTKMINPSNN